jgi:hypothetical protein
MLCIKIFVLALQLGVALPISSLSKRAIKPIRKGPKMLSTNATIFHSIAAIKSASAPAYKAWATMRANSEMRSEAAHKAWRTMRAQAEIRSQRAHKAWETRRAQATI